MGEQHDDERRAAQPRARQPEVESLTVRPARAADRAAVMAFCARTWGDDGDYIPAVWDEWLMAMQVGQGALLVAAAVVTGQSAALGTAEPAGRPVGLLHVRMVADDEAWIEGVRVDPTERRQGIGRSLVARGLVAAREQGAAVARFFTGAENVASQQLFDGFGFTRVAELLAYQAPALAFGETPSDPDAGPTPDAPALAEPMAAAPDGSEAWQALTAAGLANDPVALQLTTPGVETADRIWDWLTQSNLTPFNGGLELYNWTARALTEDHLRAYLAAEKVLLLEGWDTILALAILGDDTADAEEDTGEDTGDTVAAEEPQRHAPGAGALNVRYLDGSADGLSRLCLALREVAGERGLARVNLWLPDLLILRDAMDGAGYARRGDEAMWAYARALGQA